MIIERLGIQNFGKLHNKTVDLDSGINVIYGENEAGKSTIHGFIRSMFFGTERLRGKGAKKDAYTRYEPWENPGEYAGEMDFSCGDRGFRISRNFRKETERVHLVCLDDAEHLSIEHGDLAMLMGDVHEGIYDNTVSVGQLRSVTGKELAQELENYIANYQGGADEDMNLQKAKENLRQKRRQLQQEKNGEKIEQMGVLRELQGKRTYLEDEKKHCQEKIESIRKQLAEIKMPVEEDMLNNSQTEQNAKREEGDKIRNLFLIFAIVWTGIALFTMILAVVFRGTTVSIVCVLVALVAAVQVPVSLLLRWWSSRISGSNPQEIVPEVMEPEEQSVIVDNAQPLQEAKENHQRLTWQLSQLQEELQEKNTMIDNLLQEEVEVQEEQYKTSSVDVELEAINLAIDCLDKSISHMQRAIGTKLQGRMGEILSQLTQGKYTNIIIEDNMEIRLQTMERKIELHQLSRGTLEQVYFALRMAASEILCRDEPMPVILDDVFSMYDDNRLSNTLRWLADCGKQIIILTCHHREKELLKEKRITYKEIDL